MKIKQIFLMSSVATLLFLASCEKVDSFRIPSVAVNVQLDNPGLWNMYGVSGYGQYRYFIKAQRVPANYSYTSMSYTGYGGVLLISGRDALSGNYNYPLAYDLACPVEAKSDVIVNINSAYEAVCPKCGSRYNVCEGDGAPISGSALELKYGLQRYNVIPSTLGGYIIVR